MFQISIPYQEKRLSFVVLNAKKVTFTRFQAILAFLSFQFFSDYVTEKVVFVLCSRSLRKSYLKKITQPNPKIYILTYLDHVISDNFGLSQGHQGPESYGTSIRLNCVVVQVMLHDPYLRVVEALRPDATYWTITYSRIVFEPSLDRSLTKACNPCRKLRMNDLLWSKSILYFFHNHLLTPHTCHSVTYGSLMVTYGYL